jgi:hypothetical protein
MGELIVSPSFLRLSQDSSALPSGNAEDLFILLSSFNAQTGLGCIPVTNTGMGAKIVSTQPMDVTA